MVNDGDENIPWDPNPSKNHLIEQIQLKETQPRYVSSMEPEN